MTKGIHNPFEEPKKKKKKQEFKSAMEYADTEAGLVDAPKATFDCKTHVIMIHEVKSVKAAVRKLVELFIALEEADAAFMHSSGVRVVPLSEDTPILAETELRLDTKSGYLIVDTGHDTRDEDGAVRRLANTLLRLPGGKDVLKQHRIDVYKRSQ